MVQPSAQKESVQIPFVTRLCVGHVDNPKHISFDELDSTFDLARTCFIEVVDNPKYVRPYFIFNIKRLDYDLYDDIIDWLYSLEDVFGEVSIGGVCTHIDMSDYTGLPFTDCDLGNYLILHAVYFHSCITANDMMEIIKERVVHEAADRSVYRLNDGPLLFKHICSPTRFRKSLNQNDQGMIMDNLPKSSQIICLRGDEELIFKAKWEKLFPLKSTRQSRAKSRSALRRERRKAKKECEQQQPQPQPQPQPWTQPQPCNSMDESSSGNDSSNDSSECLQRPQTHQDANDCLRPQSCKDANADALRVFKNTIMGNTIPPEESTEINELIFLDKRSLLDMLAYVNAGSPNNIRKVIGIMARSPYPKQFVIRILQEWYDKIPHKTPDTMASWVDQHYKYEETNQWFFSILKLFDDEHTRNWYKQAYTHKRFDVKH